MLPNNLLDEFANTFKEWHYFVGGLALGLVAGIVIAARLLVAFSRHKVPPEHRD